MGIEKIGKQHNLVGFGVYFDLTCHKNAFLTKNHDSVAAMHLLRLKSHSLLKKCCNVVSLDEYLSIILPYKLFNSYLNIMIL